MRYFAFDLMLKKEDIKSDKVYFKDYSYDGPIEALGCYIYKNISNGVSFVIYREESYCLKSQEA